MSSFELCKKVELHIHLEGAASPEFVREICQSNSKPIPEVFDKSGNYNWQNFDQFLHTYEIVTNLFLAGKKQLDYLQPLMTFCHKILK